MERQSLLSEQLPTEEPPYVFDQGWWVGEAVDRIMSDALPEFLTSFGGAKLSVVAQPVIEAGQELVGSRTHAYFLTAGGAGAGLLTLGGPAAPLASRFHRIPTHFPLNLHGI